MKLPYRSLLLFAFSTLLFTACMDKEATTADENAAQTTAVEVTKSEAPASTEMATEEKAVEEAPATSTETLSEAESMPKSEFIEGQDYLVLFPELETTAPEGKVEVAEIFWYGCPHCYSLEPVLKKYLEEKPDYVAFVRIPGTLNPNWMFHAKLYYIGQALDADGSKNVHEHIFNAIHQQRRRLMDNESIKEFFKSAGYTDEQIDSAMNSVELAAKLERADTFNKNSRAGSVPSLVINGKYLTSPSMARGSMRMMRLLGYLTEKEKQGTE